MALQNLGSTTSWTRESSLEAAGFGIDQWGFPEMLAAVEGPESDKASLAERLRNGQKCGVVMMVG